MRQTEPEIDTLAEAQRDPAPELADQVRAEGVHTTADAPTAVSVSNFTASDAPAYGDILNCMHCGLCLPTCPTYALTGRERSSPRGRIQMMRGVADGRLEVSPKFSEEMYFCLGCLACETACPAGVQYGRLLEHARTQVEQKQTLERKHPVAGLVRRLAFLAFEHLPLMRLSMWPLRAYQRLGIRAFLRRTGLLRLLPFNLGEMERLLPTVPLRPSSAVLPTVTPARGERKARVGILLGCVMDVFCADENLATVRVLARNGCEVVAPKDAGCCGALHAHAGDLPQARELAKRVIAAFEAAKVEAVVLNSAGCGAAMREYGHWFHNDPEWAERAAAFSAKVVDLTEWLAEHGLETEGLGALNLTLTYHDACHLHHAQKVVSPPRTVLSQLPGVKLVELPESNWCCGSAGIYNLTHFPEAVALLDRKMGNVAKTGARVVVTGNPGCLLQLQYGVVRHGLPVEAIHTAVLLDRAYGGADD